MESEAYRTIKGEAEAKLVRKGSRFIALAHQVTNKEEIKERLEEVKRRYHDATHHCYAYRLITGEGIATRADDAGEPGGSAGPPILQVLEGRGLLNVLVIVVRYFGGTKLGIGGLIRAYGDAAKEALHRAAVVTEPSKERLSIRFPPELTGKVIRLVNQSGAEIKELDYAERSMLTVELPVSQEEVFRRALVDASSGKVEFLESCE